VLVLLSDYADRSFANLRALYRLEREQDNESAVKLIRSQIRNLQEYDWKKLAAVMGSSAVPVWPGPIIHNPR